MSTSRHQPTPLAEVTYRADGESWTLTFIRELPQAPPVVWSALTDPAQLSAWAPYDANRNLGSVGPATLEMIDGETREPLAAEVLRVDEPRLLEYTWGEDRLLWELTPSGAGTRLTLTHTTAELGWIPKLAASWHICLDVAEQLMTGGPTPRIVGSEALEHGWADLRDGYAAALDIEVDDEDGAAA